MGLGRNFQWSVFPGFSIYIGPLSNRSCTPILIFNFSGAHSSLTPNVNSTNIFLIRQGPQYPHLFGILLAARSVDVELRERRFPAPQTESIVFESVVEPTSSWDAHLTEQREHIAARARLGKQLLLVILLTKEHAAWSKRHRETFAVGIDFPEIGRLSSLTWRTSGTIVSELFHANHDQRPLVVYSLGGSSPSPAH